MKIVFSGKRDKRLEARLESNNHMIESFINESIDFVIKDDQKDDRKIAQAEKLEIPIVTSHEFKEMFGY